MSGSSTRETAAKLVAAAVSVAALAWSLDVWHDAAVQHAMVCVEGTTEAHYEKAIAALDSNIDFGLKISVALLGGGGALLIGLKEGLRPGIWNRCNLVIALLFFMQSSLYGIWWRIGIANAWLQECLNFVSEPAIMIRYAADMNFFLAGLLMLGLLILVAVFTRATGVERDEARAEPPRMAAGSSSMTATGMLAILACAALLSRGRPRT